MQDLQTPLGNSCGGGSAVRLRLTPNATPRQVVLLGAGMDTRAWRLRLPPGERLVAALLLRQPLVQRDNASLVVTLRLRWSESMLQQIHRQHEA